MTRRLLVVDDEKNIRFTVVHALKSDNYEVDAAPNGIEGLRTYVAGHYDLLLIDLRMPGMTGLEMLREIRHISPDAPPAVIITAYGVPKQLFEAAELGAIDFIRKPFSIQMIRGLIRDIFDRIDLDPSASADGSLTAGRCLQLGKRALMARDCAQALTWLRRAIQLDPALVDAHLYLGICTLLTNDTAASIEHFRRALVIDATNKTAAEYLAWLAEQPVS
ncbi:MAG: response regulator [Chlorobi bacterium]|nr:response regulator [Chlorobiota bacterium]